MLPTLRVIFCFAVMRISSSVLLISSPLRASSCRLSFCAWIDTAPWLATSLMPRRCANRPMAWPAATVKRLRTLKSALLLVAARVWPAASCKCSGVTRAMPAGAETRKPASFSCPRASLRWAGTASSASSAPTEAALRAKPWTRRSASSNCPTASAMLSISPWALGCLSALMKMPLPARMAAWPSVRSSAPWPRGLRSASTRCPRFS
ncbi:hypothetical protein D3C77_437890 [compost metagenome]